MRYHAIDKLRVAMISIIMFGHPLLPYITVPRRFQDPRAVIGFDIVGIFLYSFAMQAFFITAGFAAALVLERRGALGLLADRWKRIFVPFLFAWLLLAPLTRAAYDFAREVTTTLSLSSGFEVLMQGHWLKWNKLYHLWFLPTLMIFVLVAVAGHWLLGCLGARRRTVGADGLHALFASRWRAGILFLALCPFLVPAYILPNGGDRTALMGGAFLLFFYVGWSLYRNRDLLEELGRQAWPLIGIAVAALPLTAWATRVRLIAEGSHDAMIGIVAGLGNALLAACMTLGLLGLFQARLNRPSPVWSYINGASYWIYLIHYPPVIFVGALLLVVPLPALVKYLLTVGIVVPLVLASFHFGARRTALGRVLIGGKRQVDTATS